MNCVLAADIGGTNIRLAIIDQHGQILAESRMQADLSSHTAQSQTAQSHAAQPQADAEAHIITTLAQAIDDFLAQSTYKPSRIGIGFPGFFHGNSGVLAASPNLPLLQDFPLAESLGKALNNTVVAQNDALCAAIGEHRFGAGQGQRNLLHITLGTGIGGGLILNHQPYSGEHGMAMEFGHLCVAPNKGHLCGCGNHGCVESYASASAIVHAYAQQTGINTNAKNIYQQACHGDHIAINILQQAGSYLGQAIAESIKLLDISTITVSGGLTGAWSMFYPSLMDSLNAHLIPPLKGEIQVLRSSLNDNAGLLGAAAIAANG